MNVQPVAYDLFCGLGGWAEGFLAEGYRVIGFDIEAHRYPRILPRQSDGVKNPGLNWSDRSKRGSKDAQFNRSPDLDPEGGWEEYPGELILRDVRSIHGSELKDATVIVASPPCQAYSYRAMPWKRAKALPPPDNTLFNECFRIQREASAAAGRYIPLIVENVRGAQKWVGRAQWNYGSFYLWGDVPALMPITIRAQKFNPDGTNHGQGSWFAIADSKNCGVKVPHRTKGHWTNPAEHEQSSPDGLKIGRKMASAMIAKIPFPLSQHIARCYKPAPYLTTTEDRCTPSL